MISMCWFWAVADLAEKAANASARPAMPAAHRNDFAVIMIRSRGEVAERGEYKPTRASAACVTNTTGEKRSARARRSPAHDADHLAPTRCAPGLVRGNDIACLPSIIGIPRRASGGV